jgi:hypothetical protein
LSGQTILRAAGGGVDTGRVCHGSQVKGDDPDNRDITWSYRLVVRRGANQPAL